MTVTVLTQASQNAPSWRGQPGDLIAVKDFCLVANLGWTKPYSWTNQAGYKQPVGSNGFYLRVDDADGQNARLRGCETMNGINAIGGEFPTNVQVNNGLYLFKSAAADVTARPWIFASNGKIFYFFWSHDGTIANWNAGTGGRLMAFGDFKPKNGSDGYNTVLISDSIESATYGSIAGGRLATSLQAMTAGHYVPRPWSGIGSSTNVGKFTDYIRTNGAQVIGGDGITYAGGNVEGGLTLAPLWLSEPGKAGERGLLPGLWCPCHNQPLAHNDTFTGKPGTSLEGKTFRAISLSSGQVMIETSDTWDA